MEKKCAEQACNVDTRCSYRNGPLQQCAPLALSYTPIQQENPPRYSSNEALARGTLFPGLDLPFKNIVNQGFPLEDTPLGELMALDFVTHELGLYLDTHTDDEDAFEVYQRFLRLAKEGRERYIKMYGPVKKTDLLEAESFTWLDAPWPWMCAERRGK